MLSNKQFPRIALTKTGTSEILVQWTTQKGMTFHVIALENLQKAPTPQTRPVSDEA